MGPAHTLALSIAMKAAIYLSALAATTSALSIPSGVRQGIQQLASGQNPLATAEKYLIELAPGEQRWVTDEEKWELRRQGQSFFDITDTPELSLSQHEQSTVTFPKKTAYNESVSPLLKELDKKQMKKHLETFTGFHTRYYKSDYGAQSSTWLLDQVNQTLAWVLSDTLSIPGVRTASSPLCPAKAKRLWSSVRTKIVLISSCHHSSPLPALTTMEAAR